MSATDWAKDKRRHQATEERAEIAYEDARGFAIAQLGRDQARAAKLIRAHPEEPRFKWMAGWIDAGKFLGKEHVASVFQIAADRGWRMPTADAFVPQPVFEGYEQLPRDDAKVALQTLDQYRGSSPGLLRLKSRTADPAWLPSPSQVTRIKRFATGSDTD